MAESYEKAGVNLEAGYEVVRRIKKHVASTSRLGVMGNIGAFGGMFDLSALRVEEPVLVSGTDGVGTKLKLAFAMDKHDTIGIDAVAMCVNDVLAQGAEPLLFLDYVAVGCNEPRKIEAIVAGVAEGCRQAGCALVGGETAEMPGMYADGEYDIAGFTVGVVEKKRLIDGSKVKVGDVLVGVASSGVHSNGFSLVRKIVADNALNLHESYPELSDRLLGEVLLTPTKIYVKQVLEVIRSCDVHGISHITGGGFDENIPRILREGQGIRNRGGFVGDSARVRFLEKYGKVPHREMFNIFNMGIGMVIALDAARRAGHRHPRGQGERAAVIGRVPTGTEVSPSGSFMHRIGFSQRRGDQFRGIAGACERGVLDACVALLVCDRPEARAVGRARAHGPYVRFCPRYPPRRITSAKSWPARCCRGRIGCLAVNAHRGRHAAGGLRRTDYQRSPVAALPAFRGGPSIEQALSTRQGLRRDDPSTGSTPRSTAVPILAQRGAVRLRGW